MFSFILIKNVYQAFICSNFMFPWQHKANIEHSYERVLILIKIKELPFSFFMCSKVEKEFIVIKYDHFWIVQTCSKNGIT